MSYIVLVRDRIEADEELKNKNAIIIAEESIPCVTLPEHLRLQFFHWLKTGQHLDLKNLTLCVGSRYQDGGVPCVGWSGGELRVDWCIPRVARDCIRARAVSV